MDKNLLRRLTSAPTIDLILSKKFDVGKAVNTSRRGRGGSVVSKCGVLVLSAGLIFSLSPSASGATVAPNVESVIKATTSRPPAFNKAELEDLAHVASQKNQSLDSMTKSQAADNEFAASVEKVKLAFPDTFAGSSLQTTTQGKAWIGFTGAVPKNVGSKITSSSVDIELRGNFPVSEVDGEKMSNDIVSFLNKPGGPTVMGGINFETGHVELTTSKLIDSATMDKAVALAQKSVGSKTPIVITQEVKKALKIKFQVLSGGATLAKGYAPNGPAKCTAAFGVYNTQGGSGIMTADHCDDDLNYEDRLNMNFRGGAFGVNTDAQWHSSTQEGPWNRFIAMRDGANLINRGATSYGDPVGRNATICKYGDITNYDCAGGVILSNRSIPNPKTGIVYSGLDLLDRGFTSDGDSGGPVFFGNRALGLISGEINDGNRISTFVTPISRIYNNTNLRVLTS